MTYLIPVVFLLKINAIHLSSLNVPRFVSNNEIPTLSICMYVSSFLFFFFLFDRKILDLFYLEFPLPIPFLDNFEGLRIFLESAENEMELSSAIF